ncbi:MAG TPA: heparinase II/III family protein, partial [Pyrinomonadaceae bacterium]|nr:heparinase II/III family protein [Pyrinomonadaceae bacterium]
MAVVPMANPLEKLKKIRSWDEIRTRGGQAFSVYREQKHGRQVPTDEEFLSLIDAAQFGKAPIIAESLWQKFYKNGDEAFFPSFKEAHESRATFTEAFSPVAAEKFINAAKKILDGRIDLMGLKNLFVGSEIDWHREPVSLKRSPLKHWKEFDDLESGETGNKKIIWELNRHQHFFTLGVAYMLTGDERFAASFAGQ